MMWVCRKWREGRIRPIPGNALHDRPVSRGIGSSKRVCDPSCPATAWLRLQRTIPRPLVCVFSGMAESFGPMWFLTSKPNPGSETVPPPAGRSRAQVKERAGKITPSSSSAMSSDRLILDRVARQHCPSPLHRQAQINMHFSEAQMKGDISTLPEGRHFYFALTRSLQELEARTDL